MTSLAAADITTMKATEQNTAQNMDWSLNIQVFLYLQTLDVLTTWLGFRTGLAEASPFIQFLMHLGPLTGLLASKVVAVVLGGFCVWRNKMRVITWINYWYAGLVVWNLTLIVTR
jgi:hypothetical protein